MVAWCGKRGFDLTFIEVMPMGDIGNETRLNQYWPLSMVRAELKRRWTQKKATLQPLARPVIGTSAKLAGGLDSLHL